MSGACSGVKGLLGLRVTGVKGWLPLYAVIVQQQPESVFDGLTNLINTTLPDNFTCVISSTTFNFNTMADDTADYNGTDDYDSVECSQHDTIISLTILPCIESIMLTVDDEGTTLLSEVLESMPLSQTLDYVTTEGDIGNITYFNVSLEVVSINESKYFIITLNSSVQLNFPMTAIPIDCSITGTVIYKHSMTHIQ